MRKSTFFHSFSYGFLTFRLFLGYNFLCHINKIYYFNRQNLSKTAIFALHFSQKYSVFARFRIDFARFSQISLAIF